MIEPIDLARIERMFDMPRPDPIQDMRDRLNTQAEFDKDLRIIGYGLAFAYAWVIIFRLAQMGGVL